MDRRLLALTATACLSLSACGGSSGADATNDDGTVSVVASFYPLEYAAQRVGGDRVEVTNLTRPGADPHDAELTAKDVAIVSEADFAVYEKGLQPSVDQAIQSQQVRNSLDVASVADLSLRFSRSVGESEDGHEDHGHEGHDHATESPETQESDSHEGDDHAAESPETQESDSHEGHDHSTEEGAADPHFWLDPIRYGKVAQAVAAQLGEIDPEGAQTYDANAQAFVGELETLDTEFQSGLANCTSRDLVTSHAAFGYLADRYDLRQVAISGLSPENEPDPGTLAQIADFTKRNDVKTVYTETLASPAIARTLAAETGAAQAVLDPLEGLTEESAGEDYLAVMRANLQTLKKGQGCS